jgi:phosphoglucomutase
MGEGSIRFGTSGWRGVIGEEVTLSRAYALARAVGRWLRESGAPARALVARDARPGGEALAREATAALGAERIRVVRAAGVTPTPVVTGAVVARGFGAGLIFTASHNPPAYHGLKVIGADGSVLAQEPSRRIEQLAEAWLAAPGARPSRGAGTVVDLVPDYLEALGDRLDRAALAAARPRVLYDAMHGAGAGVLDRLLARAGARVETLHARHDARFGGQAPDPEPGRLAALAAAVRGARGLRLGLASDGDADRYAAVDADGRILSATQLLALLVDHLARSGRVSRGVAISVATGSLVERVARAHGLEVSRHPIGFTWLSRVLLDGRADCAGEESGGFAWAVHGVDKDGLLACALLAELVATSRAPLGTRLAELERRHGACHCGRLAVPARAAGRERLAALSQAPPARVAGARVRDVDRRDGLRLGLGDGFLMLRGSGTEPALRVYAEAPSAAGLRARLALGARWLGADASGNFAN